MSSFFTPVYFSKSPSVIGVLILALIVVMSSIYISKESFSFVLGEFNKVIIYMVHWNNSYKFGKAQEARIHPVIKEYFKKDIIPTEGQYAKYDFYDNDTNYEVKSRTNTYSKYPSTMITLNKCCDCDKDKDLILIFNFTDGLYFIKFDEELFKLYSRNMFSRANIEEDEKEHVYIPISHLTLIQKWDIPTIPALSKSGGF